MSTPSPVIETRGLHKNINSGSQNIEILKDIDLIIPRAQFVAIMGPSGSGKSTLLGLLAGLDTPSKGEILLEGREISNLSEDEMTLLRAQKIGFVFQSYNLVTTLTAEENVLLPLDLSGNGSRDSSRANRLLDTVGLSDRTDHYPVQLSGGEQQRVALARAFVAKPPIIMADEPTGNLDTFNGKHILEILVGMNRREQTTLLMVTHDRDLANQADRLIELQDGRIVSDKILKD